jgi:hypothetical protein
MYSGIPPQGFSWGAPPQGSLSNQPQSSSLTVRPQGPLSNQVQITPLGFQPSSSLSSRPQRSSLTVRPQGPLSNQVQITPLGFQPSSSLSSRPQRSSLTVRPQGPLSNQVQITPLGLQPQSPLVNFQIYPTGQLISANIPVGSTTAKALKIFAVLHPLDKGREYCLNPPNMGMVFSKNANDFDNVALLQCGMTFFQYCLACGYNQLCIVNFEKILG